MDWKKLLLTLALVALMASVMDAKSSRGKKRNRKVKAEDEEEEEEEDDDKIECYDCEGKDCQTKTEDDCAFCYTFTSSDNSTTIKGCEKEEEGKNLEDGKCVDGRKKKKPGKICYCNGDDHCNLASRTAWPLIWVLSLLLPVYLFSNSKL